MKPAKIKPFKSSSTNIARSKLKASKHLRVMTPADYSQLTDKSNWVAKTILEAKGLTSNKPVVKTSKLKETKTNPLAASNAGTNHTAATPPAADFLTPISGLSSLLISAFHLFPRVPRTL